MKAQSKLSKKSFTVVEQACHQMRGSRNLSDELGDKVRFSGQSSGTLKNYPRKLAQISLHFGKRLQHIRERPDLMSPVSILQNAHSFLFLLRSFRERFLSVFRILFRVHSSPIGSFSVSTIDFVQHGVMPGLVPRM
jgi:hypothetical protein